MTITAPARRPSVAARRAGYAVAAVLNGAFLYLVNVWPGWQVVPFLTDDTRQVLGLVNLSLVASLLVNVLYLVHDPPWFRSLGDLVTTAISLAVLARIWQVFPFAFTDSGPWSPLTRLVLVVAIAGTAIALVGYVASLLRNTFGQRTPG